MTTATKRPIRPPRKEEKERDRHFFDCEKKCLARCAAAAASFVASVRSRPSVCATSTLRRSLGHPIPPPSRGTFPLGIGDKADRATVWV
ncbi:hypothetical protein EYF80_057174 [Liparis tanakae]|uniref:Uncharacterized protein n=1 Tax=Liparis tanakae TaxID=230148 RepID=A0A4Z2EUY2_9TELE|nr:hypothetical protein EYF80_057174 [Liparis tanakae]